MAKHVISEAYTFTPGTKTVVINGKHVRREQLVLITEVTTNTVIYNFADSNLKATSYSLSTINNVETTTILLNFDTTGMSPVTSKLMIIVDEVNESFMPSETMMDANTKMRVSLPQSLIDTDFEYGPQPTKWETLSLLNGRPSAFYDESSPLGIASLTATNGSRVVSLVTNAAPTTPTTATPIYIQDTIWPEANGWFMPTSVSGTTPNFTITYNTRSNWGGSTGSIFDQTKTFTFVGSLYNGSGIPISVTANTAFTGTTTTLTCTTINAHGLTPGDGILISGTTASTNAPNGTWFVKTTPTSNTFTFDVISAPTGNNITPGSVSGSGLTVTTTAIGGLLASAVVAAGGTNYQAGDIVSVTQAGGSGGLVKIISVAAGVVNGVQIAASGSGYGATGTGLATVLVQNVNTLFPRTWGYSAHRPFDGGVEFTAGLPYSGNQLIRQTRRYFRYQSGKAIMFSTGSNMSTPFKTDAVTSSGDIVTVNTKFPHNLNTGARLRVEGANETAYNGLGDGTFYTVLSVPSLTQLTYRASATPSASIATGNFTIQPYRWFGSQVRLGMFDLQNGFFFEFDGQTLYAVRRSSTFQCAGYISTLGTGSHVVTGTNTQFSKQLNVGDWVVIRGMSHLVHSIESDTSMTIYPDYKGQAITPPMQAIFNRTDNFRTAQSSWNIDKLDGTGVSGYNLDINKMQMWIMDYSWYGAGAIRFGVKNQRGEFVYCHRMAHANAQTEAYMRSGNLPARYELSTIPPITRLTQTLSNSETSTINVASTEFFPTSGTVAIQASGNTGAAIEYINYTGKTATTLTGLTRQVTNLSGPGGLTGLGGTGTAATFTPTATAPIGVSLYAPLVSNAISHWGSSVIMDGRYDDDKNFLFNYGQNATQTFATSGTTFPVFSIRAAPSVDNGIAGILGQRELINRMQVTLRSVGVFSTSTAAVRVSLRLNGRIGTVPGTWTPVGGASLVQYALHGTTGTITGGTDIFTFFVPGGGVTTQTLFDVRDLGNSILGGGNTLNGPATFGNQYPDGPDVLTICVTPLSANAAVAARLAWTEAQA